VFGEWGFNSCEIPYNLGHLNIICFRRDFGNYLSSSIIHISSGKMTELRHQPHPHQLHEYSSLSVNSETHLAISPLMPLIKMQLMGKPWPSPFSLMHHRLCIPLHYRCSYVFRHLSACMPCVFGFRSLDWKPFLSPIYVPVRVYVRDLIYVSSFNLNIYCVWQ